ncbi:DUF3658 domain-containing protein [Paenibacillus methanolicus]|nr:DUF3658 domain-containing protein [Paenibacillus methanolicus]
MEAIIAKTRNFVKAALEHDASGHDWWHIVRVARSAKLLAGLEGGDPYVCELAALLHDIADEKLNVSKEAGLRRVEDWLAEIGVDASTSETVMLIVSTMSYGGGGGAPMETIEGKVVQDADRLDAIGAIAAARTFVYSGWKGRLIYDPYVRPRASMTKEEYRSGKDTAINHFYEKLLKLKALLNTESARMLAEERHAYMLRYLEAFDREWELGNPDYLEERLGEAPEPERIHVVFDASAAHSLRFLLRDKPGEYVVSLADDLSVGPLDDNGADARAGGVKRRMTWLAERGMLGDAEAEHFGDCIDWRNWPDRLAGRRIVVWAAGNANEQSGLRRLMAHIPGQDEVRVIDAPGRIFEKTNGALLHTHTGEVAPRELDELMEQGQALTAGERSDYADDWRRLIREDGELRAMVEGRLQSVPEDYWDDMILQSAIVVAASTARMFTAARLVGQLIGRSDQRLNDSFLFYRIRCLAESGKLEGGGNPERMGGYKVGFGEPASLEGPDHANIQAYMDWARRYTQEADALKRHLSTEKDADEQVLEMLRALSEGSQADTRMRRMVAKFIDDFMNERRLYANRRNAILGMLSSMRRTDH